MAPNSRTIAGAAKAAHRPINVVSGFDGIGGARAALDHAGVPVQSYTAYEIDPVAASIAKQNYPDIDQRGDIKGFVRPGGSVDLLCGGFPCQDLSRANVAGRGLEGERSGSFYDLQRMMDEIQPNNFLIENVVPKGSMNHPDIARISKELGVDPVLLDAKDFGAMSRPRLFWTDIPIQGYRPSGAMLRDALLDEVPEKYMLSDRAVAYMNRPAGKSGRTHFERHGMRWDDEKASTIPSVIHKGVPYNALQLPDGSMRKLAPEEIEGLFGFPQGYTAGQSDTQRYKALGNSWSVPTVSHILKGLLPQAK